VSNALNKQHEILSLGAVAVFCGGDSAEREVSLDSGRAVEKALQAAGVHAFLVDTHGNLLNIIQKKKFDRVFLALHGRGGEDGMIQGFLESLNIPYTGSGVLASALAMDKVKTKQIWMDFHLATPDFFYIYSDLNESNIKKAEKTGYPLCVKPVSEGSSIGVYKVSNRKELLSACKEAMRHQSPVLIEKWVQGKEFTVGILGSQCLPVIGLSTDHEFYDYDAKYIDPNTRYLLPSGLEKKEEEKLQQLCLDAYLSVGCSGWGRVDAIQDRNGKFWLLEVNTTPGMTSHSLVPMAARAADIEFSEFCLRILQQTLQARA